MRVRLNVRLGAQKLMYHVRVGVGAAENPHTLECATWLPETREPEKKTRESRHRAGQI